jgi:hypothetical protein
MLVAPIELNQYQKQLLKEHSWNAWSYIAFYAVTFATFAVFYGWINHQGSVVGNICLFFLVGYVILQWMGLAGAGIIYLSMVGVNWMVKLVKKEVAEQGYTDEKAEKVFESVHKANTKFLNLLRPYPDTLSKVLYYPIWVLGIILDITLFVGFIMYGAPVMAFLMVGAFATYFVEQRIRAKGWRILQSMEPPSPEEEETMDELMDKLVHGDEPEPEPEPTDPE